MIQVGGVAGPAPVSRKLRRSGSGAFAMPLEENGAAAGTARTEGMSAVTLSGMLALQEEEPPEQRDRRARRHGQAILDELAKLQRALLGGRIDAGALARLEALTEMVPDAADPTLGALIRSVALRARIELARHDLPTANVA